MPGYRISVKRGRGYQLPVLVSVIIISALAAVVSILFWRFHYDGGFSWTSEPAKQFSWHPLLMTTSLVTMGLGSIIYRVTPCISRKVSKALHSVVMLCSVGVGVVGVMAVWQSHALAQPPIPHMFSLHSWLGLTTLIFMALQLLLGMSVFLLPCAPSRIRAAYHHLHVFCGLAFVMSATAASLMGLTEEAIFSLATSYTKLVGKGILLNCIGLFLTVFSTCVIYIAAKPSFKPLD